RNFGTISASDTVSGYGILLRGGGIVGNGVGTTTSAALISGGDGVVFELASGTVSNGGTIRGAGNFGVYLGKGGIVGNGLSFATGALISGGLAGIYIRGAAGTVIN